MAGIRDLEAVVTQTVRTSPHPSWLPFFRRGWPRLRQVLSGGGGKRHRQ
jgi:hypothetical protein